MSEEHVLDALVISLVTFHHQENVVDDILLLHVEIIIITHGLVSRPVTRNVNDNYLLDVVSFFWYCAKFVFWRISLPRF